MIAVPTVTRIARAPSLPPSSKAMPAKRARVVTDIAELADAKGVFAECSVDAVVVQLLFGHWRGSGWMECAKHGFG